MLKFLPSALAGALLATGLPALAQVTFYQDNDFRGRSYSTATGLDDFSRVGFNDRASSIIVQRDRWQICQDVNFGGPCVVLGPGRYASLSQMGLNDRVSSVRMAVDDRRANDDRYGRPGDDRGPSPWRRRDNERLYEANVQSVRAVMGPPEQRCWVERQAVQTEDHRNGVGGAVAGALLGGILGHQLGGGSGRDLATVGGVVAGAAIGSQVGRANDGPVLANRDVQRCAETPGSARTDYWDVTYTFRGQAHRVQMSAPPGPTVTVNRLGEPRS
jgi:uncharacterized protein YcfJ